MSAQRGGYLAHILPEITYDRAAIGNRAARIRLTQEILRAFEPAIRQHLTQWFHFVPIWPDGQTKMKSSDHSSSRSAFFSRAAKLRAAETGSVFDHWFAAQKNVPFLVCGFCPDPRAENVDAAAHRPPATCILPCRTNFRWELGRPAQTIALRHGDEMFVIYPRLKRAERYPLGAGAPTEWRDTMSLLQAGFPHDRKEFESQFQILSLMETNGAWQFSLQPKSRSRGG